MKISQNVTDAQPAKIVVVGVGGGGGNAINRMKDCNFMTASFIAINTDKIALATSKADHCIQIGAKLTSGQGAGADPGKGQSAAEENKLAITEAIKDADLVFITAGMGGGTGTGAAPTIAAISKELGKLTIAVVTKPFSFEGKVRMDNAEIGIANLKKVVDTLVVVPNEKLMQTVPEMQIMDAFKYADDVLRQGIQGISDLIVNAALINLDFADVCTIMRNKGVAHMGIGVGKGDRRTAEAVKSAVCSPLLETTIEGATSCILNIIGPRNINLNEIKEAAELVKQVVDPSANIIFGADVRDGLTDEVVITVIATGFNDGRPPVNTGQIPAQQSQQQAQPSVQNSLLGRLEGNQGGGLNVFGGAQRPQQAPTPQPQPVAQPVAQPQQAPAQPMQQGNIPRTHVSPVDTSDFPPFLRKINEKNNGQ